jgi:hypothetical protein
MLWEALKEAYTDLAQNRQFFFRLIELMPNRIVECIEKGGGSTHY